MVVQRASRWAVAVVAAAGVVMTGQVRAESPEAAFHRAYYLDREVNDYAGAAKLYEKVLDAREVDAALRAQAGLRLAICQEEVAAADLAALMPPDTFAYAELRQPADQLNTLIGNLGLLKEGDGRSTDAAQRVSVSPALVEAILGVRGVAVGLNRIDFVKGKPCGVVIFHPGDVEVIRGLIETGLPAGGQALDSIEGFAVYNVEGEAYVALTHRLVVVSSNLDQVKGALRRLTGKDKNSLLSNASAGELLKGREDSLLHVFVRAEPIMPMIEQMLAMAAAHDPDVTMARAMLDPKSLKSVVGRLGVRDDALFFQVELNLAEGHRNLVYNLLRMPPIDASTFDSIPFGAAAFVTGALNNAPPSAPASTPAEDAQVVTAMDFGREIFGNIAGVVLFALPPDHAPQSDGSPIPHIAGAISVHDPSKSEALWMQILGLASLASGAKTMEGETVDIAGVPVRTFTLENDVTLYFATTGHHVLMASTKYAMTQTIKVQRGGESIRKDPAFAASMSCLTDASTKAVFAHPGRCIEVARPFMSESDQAEVAPFLGLLTDTVASLVIDHSHNRFRLSAEVTGIPKVGGLVTQLIEAEEQKKQRSASLEKAIQHKEWDKSVKLLDDVLADQPNRQDLLVRKFRVLAIGKNDRAAALAWGEQIFDRLHDDAEGLNDFAWALLTEDRYDGAYHAYALQLAERSNELSRQRNWAYLDTLALAKFLNGDAEAAVKIEEKAISLAGDRNADELNEALARFKEGIE